MALPADLEARILALEDKLPAWSTRLQRLERFSPLEARLRRLEVALAELETGSGGASGNAANHHSRASPGGDGTIAIPSGMFLGLAARSIQAVLGSVWLGKDGLLTILKRMVWPRASSDRPVADPSHGKVSEHDAICNPRIAFCLKPGIDGYSQSLDIENCDSALTERAKISALHREAVARELDSYIDPATGYDVFSAYHLKTRECCGSSCRHCPWGHRNVPGKKRRASSEKQGQMDASNATSLDDEPSTNDSIHHSDDTSQVPPKSRLYTRKGDTGWGELYSGQAIPKSDPIYDAIGEVDELNSAIGLAVQLLSSDNARADGTPEIPAHAQLHGQLETIQAWLLDAASALCTPRTGTTNSRKLRKTSFAASSTAVLDLERWIDVADAQLVRLQNFILPGGSPGSAALHSARSVCRRAERHVWPLLKKGHAEEDMGVFLNRLSDYLFVAARVEAHFVGAGDARYGIDRRSGDRWQRQIIKQ